MTLPARRLRTAARYDLSDARYAAQVPLEDASNNFTAGVEDDPVLLPK